jgi:hypothetical protein
LTHAEALAAWRIDGELRDGTTLPLCRLRYGGSANS